MSTPSSPIHVTLEIKSGSRSVPATLTFRNRSTESAWLYKINACEQGRVRHDLFVIASKDGEVDYIGPYFRRREPELNADYLELGPGEDYTVTVYLAETYDFPAGAGEYEAYYEAFDPAAPGDELWLMRSEPVRFTLPG